MEIPIVTLWTLKQNICYLYPVGSERNSLALKGTGRIVACQDIPSPVEFRSRPEGIHKVGVRRSSTSELFSSANRRVSAPRRRFNALSHPRPIFRRWNSTSTWRAWKVKIASVNHYCIAGVARHPAKVKQFAGPYIDDVTPSPPLSLFPPPCFLSSSFTHRSVGSFSRHCGEFSWTTCHSRWPYLKTFDDIVQRFVVLRVV